MIRWSSQYKRTSALEHEGLEILLGQGRVLHERRCAGTGIDSHPLVGRPVAVHLQVGGVQEERRHRVLLQLQWQKSIGEVRLKCHTLRGHFDRDCCSVYPRRQQAKHKFVDGDQDPPLAVQFEARRLWSAVQQHVDVLKHAPLAEEAIEQLLQYSEHMHRLSAREAYINLCIVA